MAISVTPPPLHADCLIALFLKSENLFFYAAVWRFALAMWVVVLPQR
jgi:hypothetical protein